ncbi:TPA: phytanoyl-CoA dioxygenase, partial [Candidatus Poribacteria bacterium]|nr:phytanoyl-CoA dioxygenase [Candidatus Poribacteria bacterium]
MKKTSLRFLTIEQVRQFKLNGFLVVEDVLSKDEVEVLAARTDLIAASKVDQVPDTSIQLEKIFGNGDRLVTNQILSVRKLYNLAVYDQVMWQH